MSAIPDACATRRGPIRLRFAALILLAIALIPACVSRIAPTSENTSARVLFVGNSLTYVGNTPAIYAALAKANGHPVTADMIVRGGATLTQRVADGSVAAALETGEYTALVLQERGGDLMCAFGPASCVESRAALKVLAGLGRQHGVSVILLGSYQPHPAASRELVDAEAAAAQAVGIPYVEISQTLQALRSQAPDLSWFAADGMHPGPHLALLNAVRVHQTLHHTLPAPAALTVTAPIYDVRSGLTETLRPADAPPPLPDTPLQTNHPAATLARLLDAIRQGARSNPPETPTPRP